VHGHSNTIQRWMATAVLLLPALLVRPAQAQAVGLAEDFSGWAVGSVPGEPWELHAVEGGGTFTVRNGGGLVSDRFLVWDRQGANNPNSALLLDAAHATGHLHVIINQTVRYTSNNTPGNGIILRWQDADNYWLISQARGTSLALHLRTDGEWTSSHSFSARGGDAPMHYRVQDDGETIRIRAWSGDQLEPEAWQISRNSRVHAGGRVGIGIGTRVWEAVPTHFFSTLQTGEADHFTVSDVASPQTAGTPFALTVTAYDADGNIATDYTGGAHLRESTGTIEPNAIDQFNDGRWQGEVRILTPADNLRILATMAGIQGRGNAFTVERAPIRDLELSAEHTVVDGGQRVEYRLTATDAVGLAFDASEAAQWHIDAEADGHWEDSTYHTGSSGHWTVTAQYGGLQASSPLQVRPMPVLTEAAYMHAYVIFEEDRIDGERLRDGGRDTIGAGRFNRLQRTLVRQLQEQGHDDADDIWFNHVTMSQPVHHFRIASMPLPPADWAAPDYDDGHWVRRRRPLQIGRHGANEDAERLAFSNVRQAFYRARFAVDDASRDGPYTLRVQYRGGVRVLLNGVEIGRGHLPPGALADDTLATRYPIEAYVRLDHELDDAQRDADGAPHMIRDVSVRYEEASEAARELGVYDAMPSAVWNRLYAARERDLELTLPPELLRAGANVLAIELRRAPIHPIVLTDRNDDDNNFWFPPRISRLDLRAASARAPSALRPRPGLQVWVQDHHSRLYEADFLEAGAAPGHVRVVGARNGSFGAQLAIRSDQAIEGLDVAVSDLRHADDAVARIPSSAVSIQGVRAHSQGAFGVIGGHHRYGTTREWGRLLYNRYGADGPGDIFDALTDSLPATVEPDTAQAVYLSVRTPAGAQPGRYHGTVQVSATGTDTVTLPLTLDVIGWTLPDPADFETFFGVYSQPIAVARYHRVEMWSEAHWALLETSHRHLGRLGGDWVDVPVLETDKFIRWVRGRDGELRFEFDQLDRYLDFFMQHVGRPRVINFTIMWAAPRGDTAEYRAEVPVTDEASDTVERMSIGPDVEDAVRRPILRQFATALRAYMESKGLADVMYWGQPWDSEGDRRIVTLMHELMPDVYWTRRSHAALPNAHYRVTSTVYANTSLPDSRVPGWRTSHEGVGELLIDGLHSAKGWRQENILLVNSRDNNAVHWCDGYFPPMSYRIYAQRALVSGFSGIGTMSLDGYSRTRGGTSRSVEWHLFPFHARNVGSGINLLLWTSRDGFNSGIRVEAMLEGMQETEARIMIERALFDGRLPEELAERAKHILNADFAETGYITVRGSRVQALIDHSQGWQERSRRLFTLAAEVAQHL